MLPDASNGPHSRRLLVIHNNQHNDTFDLEGALRGARGRLK